MPCFCAACRVLKGSSLHVPGLVLRAGVKPLSLRAELLLGFVLSPYHIKAVHQVGGVMHEDQQVKKAQFSAGELSIAYVILLYGHFNI